MPLIAVSIVGTTLILAVIVLGVVLLLWWRRGKEPIVALVLLLRKPKPLDPEVVRRLIERALKVEISLGPGNGIPPQLLERLLAAPQGPSFVVSPPGSPGVCEGSTHCLARVGSRVFVLNSLPAPYTEDREEAASAISDLRAKNAMIEHTAWLSVDLLHPAEERDFKGAYRQLGRIAAELADEDCVALFATETGIINAYDPSLDAALRGDDPMETFRPIDPVIAVPVDDEALAAATREARSRWPEFVSAFEQRKKGWHYTVKAPFQGGDEVEHMWAEVEAIEGGVVVGVLDNDPVHVPNLHCGDRVQVNVADVEDWVYTDGKAITGAFSVHAIKRGRKG